MMDKNDDEDDSGLALGFKNYPVRTRLNSSSGAGVNANSKVDMAFASADPLSELVWSPHSGLSLKCADSSLGVNKPFLPRNVEQSIKDLSASPSNRFKASRNNEVVDEEKLTVCETMLYGDRKIGYMDILFRSCRGGSSRELEASRGYCNAGKMEEGATKDNGDKSLSGSHSGQIANVAESSKRKTEQDNLADGICGSKVVTATNQELPRNSFKALPNLQSRPELDDEVTSPSGDMNKNDMALMKLELSAENEFRHLAAKGDHYLDKAGFPETSLPVDECLTNSRICQYRDKGKEKAFSDGDIHGRSSNDEDSHESVESCNSAGLFLKGIRKRSYDQEELVGSKRVKLDSSFVKWISNMVKGLSDSNKDESSSLTLTLARSNDACGNNDQVNTVGKKTDDFESPNAGFQTLFQSLYSRNIKTSEVLKDKCSKELTVAEKKSLVYLPQSCNKNITNSCKQIVLAHKEVHTHRSKGEGTLSDSLYKQVNSNAETKRLDVPEKNKPLASLWITRLYTRIPRLGNCNWITEEACESSCPNVNLHCQMTDVFSIDQNTSQARNDSAEVQVQVFEQQSSMDESARKTNRLSDELRNSEAIASVFAKRLDALRHITHPSGKRISSTSRVTCFFCGASGHDLHKCPELTQTELEDLLVKISSLDNVEESHRLCIRCFQFNHWAVACPLGSSIRSGQNLVDVKLCWDSSKKGLSTSNECKRSTASTSEADLKDKQNFSLRNFGNVIAREEMFRAVRKLRLSRSDILRWMSSNVSLSHLDGFFLRLRLGKLEAGQLGTRYHVACITGDTIEDNGSNSEKCILVDVGGIKSSVGSQYVSNHDFLEDEIKAWWSRILRSGGKVPSLDELNSKLQDKKCLGF